LFSSRKIVVGIIGVSLCHTTRQHVICHSVMTISHLLHILNWFGTVIRVMLYVMQYVQGKR